MPILYPASNRFKYARSPNGFRERRRAIQTPPEDLFSPSLLFAAMEQGAWYDPSDLSTLFQDAAGITPVTAVEQPVGLMLDKSGRGNHATQPTATSRPVLSARYNLLTKTEQFDDGGWVKNSLAITPNTASAPDGTMTADGISWGAGTSVYMQNNTVLSAGQTVTFSVWVRSSSGSQIFKLFGDNIVSSATLTATENWQRFTFTYTVATGGAGRGCGISTDGASAFNGFIWGASLVPANQADLPYQRVNTATDYDTAGFPLYLRCDGIDDWMVTGTITPGTDKAQVITGVRKLSDAATGVLFELSLNAGSFGGAFYVASPVIPTNSYEVVSRGFGSIAITGVALASFPAPTQNILNMQADISGDTLRLRVNGTQAAQSTADQGTGNFLAYPLYLFRRGGTAFPFNGHFYGAVIRFGPNLPIETIEQTEAWMAAKTGVTL